MLPKCKWTVSDRLVWRAAGVSRGESKTDFERLVIKLGCWLSIRPWETF